MIICAIKRAIKYLQNENKAMSLGKLTKDVNSIVGYIRMGIL